MKAYFPLPAVLLMFFLFASPANALFRKPDLEKIPIERLLKNLSELAETETKATTNTRYNLARVHAMAYALKVESVDIPKKRAPGDGPWFGFTPPIVPFKPVQTADKQKVEVARQHLDKAIAIFRDFVKDQPNHLPAQLGLGWCLEQSGAKAEAIQTYRDVIDTVWDKERKLKVGPLGGNFITKEAAGYLIGLLDPEKDQFEIDSLQQRVALLNKLPRPITPIAIPLKDGLAARDLEDRHASVPFDADGAGLTRRWSWITKDAAWLVHDPNRTGKIESGLQLFGNVSFWCFWENGYHALSALDDNADGILTGAELRGLALWHDVNGNGISEPGEVRPLADYGIVGLSCDFQTDTAHPDRILYSPRGILFQDGATRPTFDLLLYRR